MGVFILILVNGCKMTESKNPLDPSQICGGISAKDVGLNLLNVDFKNAVLEADGIHFEIHGNVQNCLGKDINNASLIIDSASNLSIISASTVSSVQIKADAVSSSVSFGTFKYDQANDMGVVNLKLVNGGVTTSYPIILTLSSLIPKFSVELSSMIISNQLGVVKLTSIIDPGDIVKFKLKVKNLSTTKIKAMTTVIAANGTNSTNYDLDAGSKVVSALGELGSLASLTTTAISTITIHSDFPRLQNAGFSVTLADSSNTNPWSPLSLSISISDLVTTPMVATGGFEACALLSTGAIKCWGLNDVGQIGDGTNTNRSVPTQVTGLTTGMMAVSSGGSSNCGLTNSGNVKCWGNGRDGQLGNGAENNSPTPVDVSSVDQFSILTGATAIASGNRHVCSLLNSGKIVCWGDNGSGQLGNGTNVNKSAPIIVQTNGSGDLSGAAAIAAGGNTTCAIMQTTGALKCWGDHSNGQLFDGINNNSSYPIDVPGISGAVSVKIGSKHICALLNTGGVKCWGDNSYGQLGNGTTDAKTSPTEVYGLSEEGVAEISLGDSHSCALLLTGGVKCWGENHSGEVGDGTNSANKLLPTQKFLTSGVINIACGYADTCALLSTGALKCWGNNGYGEVGDGTEGTNSLRNKPTNVLNLP